jgi:AcrR family transcriptional regulator
VVDRQDEDILDDSSTALLEAAWQLLKESLTSNAGDSIALFDHLSAATVAQKAGVTSGSFYRRFAHRSIFVEKMLDYALARERVSEYGATMAVIEKALSEGASLRTLIERGTEANLKQVESDAAFVVQVNLWSLCRARPDLRERIGRLYTDLAAQWDPTYKALADFFGLKFRPPFNEEILGVILAALTEGLTMRRIVDEKVDDGVFGLALLAMAPVVFAAPDDERTLGDLWSAAEAETSTRSLLERGGSLDPDRLLHVRTARERVQTAMADLIEAQRQLEGLLARDSN